MVVKRGPLVTSVEPWPGPSWPLVVAPGMLVRIRGQELTDGGGQADVRLGGETVRIFSVDGDGSVVAVLPDGASGVAELWIRNAWGEHSVRVVVAAAAPALLRTEAGDVAAAVAESGTVLTLYLTGLGGVRPDGEYLVHTEAPSVTAGGQTCAILFSGRAASMPGVDQIECRLPAALPDVPVKLTVRSAGHVASGILTVRVTRDASGSKE